MFKKFIKKLINALKSFVSANEEPEKAKAPEETIPENPIENQKTLAEKAGLSDLFWYKDEEVQDVQQV